MHDASKKLTAQLLLCSLLLESCYNPNLGTGKKALPAPAAPTYQQELQDKPPSPCLTTPHKHPIKFPDHPRQPLGARASSEQPPSPYQDRAVKGLGSSVCSISTKMIGNCPGEGHFS